MTNFTEIPARKQARLVDGRFGSVSDIFQMMKNLGMSFDISGYGLKTCVERTGQHILKRKDFFYLFFSTIACTAVWYWASEKR